MIIIKCAWCGLDMGTKPCNENDEANGGVSHSMCNTCEKKMYAKLNSIDDKE